MKHKPFALLLWCLLVSGPGCASYTAVKLDATRLSKPVSMSANINREYEISKHVKAEQKIPFLFLVRLSPETGSPDIREMLEPEINSVQGDAVVNVQIKGEASLGDIILPIATGVIGGIAFPPLFVIAAIPFFEDLKTYSVEGDVVKYSSQKPIQELKQEYDPLTGVQSRNVKFDPNTGLPINR